jgi:hypothetical protein
MLEPPIEEQNKSVVTCFIEEFWDERNLEIATDLFSSSRLTNQLRIGEDPAGEPRSGASVKREAAAWVAAFPDLRLKIRQLIAAGMSSLAC